LWLLSLTWGGYLCPDIRLWFNRGLGLLRLGTARRIHNECTKKPVLGRRGRRVIQHKARNRIRPVATATGTLARPDLCYTDLEQEIVDLCVPPLTDDRP